MTSNRHTTETVASAVARPEPGADDAYLDAAREMILEVGWSRTRLTDIARRAGVSRMTLYRRWPDMQTMLADLMTREWGRALGETVAQAQESTQAEDSSGETLARLTRGVVATVRALRTNPLLRRIVELDPERLLPYLLERRGRSQEQIATLLADLVQAGQSDGSIRAGDPEHLARTVLLACHGFTLSAHTMVGETGDDRDADVSAYDAELAELVERYLRP
jgi:AcrR family transcriptional regulator